MPAEAIITMPDMANGVGMVSNRIFPKRGKEQITEIKRSQPLLSAV